MLAFGLGAWGAWGCFLCLKDIFGFYSSAVAGHKSRSTGPPGTPGRIAGSAGKVVRRDMRNELRYECVPCVTDL